MHQYFGREERRLSSHCILLLWSQEATPTTVTKMVLVLEEWKMEKYVNAFQYEMPLGVKQNKCSMPLRVHLSQKWNCFNVKQLHFIFILGRKLHALYVTQTQYPLFLHLRV